jgi:hypothetical protein
MDDTVFKVERWHGPHTGCTLDVSEKWVRNLMLMPIHRLFTFFSLLPTHFCLPAGVLLFTPFTYYFIAFLAFSCYTQPTQLNMFNPLTRVLNSITTLATLPGLNNTLAACPNPANTRPSVTPTPPTPTPIFPTIIPPESPFKPEHASPTKDAPLSLPLHGENSYLAWILWAGRRLGFAFVKNKTDQHKKAEKPPARPGEEVRPVRLDEPWKKLHYVCQRHQPPNNKAGQGTLDSRAAGCKCRVHVDIRGHNPTHASVYYTEEAHSHPLGMCHVLCC